MCGIWALFGANEELLKKCDCSFKKLSHRGPDYWRLQYDSDLKGTYLGFHRLSIVCTPFGMQPMKIYKYDHLNLLCNGEIYNYKKLGKEYGFDYETGSDVECVIQLYGSAGIEDCVKKLDGVFAFCLIDTAEMCVYLARDPFGVRPLFRLVTENGFLAVSSEAKGIMDVASEINGRQLGKQCYIEQFKPGHIAKYSLDANSKATLVYEKPFYEIGQLPSFKLWTPLQSLSESDIKGNIRTLLFAAVEKRLMSNRRIGCLLSGGLDSSLISAILVNLSKKHQLPYKVQSFAIGMGDSPDILAARKVAQMIGTEHFEITFSENDVISVLDQVIIQLETADITTIRASIGMYLISRFIKSTTDTTVIFSGEGADELAQGYIYFRDAPTAQLAHQESTRLLSDIYLYDGLRADRTTSAHSLEIRVPFLDLQFANYYLNLPEEMRQPKNGIEKYLLRSAFDKENILPESILWRHKEAFSDGVAHVRRSLFEIIQDHVEAEVTNEQLSKAAEKYSHLTPKTKEAYYYREVFERHYAGQASKLTPYFWMPKWTNVSDPSARFIKHYAAKSEDTE